ncbi:hypothetical protein PCANC_06090 [Puccinia coronata f. sp. avenae]|uniref:DNA-directed RNA polymerase III subunit RPC9 n=1 Tax=Puccinia coronata f. sp. avenae TaxID=200324 RepID=A0A2N5VTW0_9BASI|nr:hypothetical protein PCANC_06090 [Puccinia coronata f. sp. avenae]
MEILNPNLIPLSALETLELIRGIKAEQERTELEYEQQASSNEQPQQLPPQANTNLNQLVANFVEHFEDPNNHLPQGKQSPESILSLCESLRNRFGQVSGRSHGLTKAERLQICDLAPTELVEIYLIIEECDLRFSEDEIQEIMNLVKKNLLSERRTTTSAPSTANNHNASNTLNGDHQHQEQLEEILQEDSAFNLGDEDDDDALVAEAREGGPAPDQELDEVPD